MFRRGSRSNYGLELIAKQLVELADGTQRTQLVFAGSVRFLGERHEAHIVLTESEDALIGTSLLNRYRLSIDFPGGRLKFRSRRKVGRKH